MLLDIAVCRGPNLYSVDQVVCVALDRARIARLRSAPLGPSFGPTLIALIGSKRPCAAVEHMGTGDERGFLEGLVELAVELQRILGSWRDYGDVALAPEGDVCRVYFGYDLDLVGVATARVACRMVWDLARTVEGSSERARCFEGQAEYLAQYRAFVRARTVAYSTMHLTSEARARDIPFQVFPQGRIVYGQGVHQRQTWDAYSDRTSLFAIRASNNKADTNARLSALGLPVPRQVVVSTVDQALAAAKEIGGPVVLKPLDAHQGRGVTVEVTEEADVADAFRTARGVTRKVIVEQFIPGDDHRLLVIAGRLVAAAIRIRAHVVGDGRASVATLVERANRDPRRGEDHDNVMINLQLDEATRRVLEEQGYGEASVPAAGETVYLSKTANIATGGSAVDVTDVIHDDNRKMAEDAALAVGLDIAGIDFLTSDIARSYREVGGGICEINCTPGLTPHYAPLESTAPPVAGAVIDYLYPPGTPSRVPIAAVLPGPDSPCAMIDLLTRILVAEGRTVGAATRDGYAVDGHRALPGPRVGAGAALDVLADPRVDTAILEVSGSQYVTEGLGFDACSVAVLLDPGDDRRAAQRLIDVTRDAVVADPRTLNGFALDSLGADRLILVVDDEVEPALAAHLAAGGRAVVKRSGTDEVSIALLHGPGRQHLIEFTGAQYATDDLAMAVVMAWSLGIDAERLAEVIAEA